jgi:hypothetical protein
MIVEELREAHERKNRPDMRLELAAQPPCRQKAQAQTLKDWDTKQVLYSLFANSPRETARLLKGSRELNHRYNTKQDF